jgi:peptidoglycan/xylan/chitin deacetylase (PgdA/CDA1 family)
MNGKIKCIIALLITAFLLSACASAGELATQKKYFEWPENHKAAVSLTFDDAIDSQAVTASPLLKKYGLTGTFFLSGRRWAEPEYIGAWKVAYEDGNEFGAHTLLHPCPRPQKLEWASEDYTIPKMKQELQLQKSFLKDRGFLKSSTVFAYPCGITWIGEDRQSYVPLIKEMFSAARAYTWDDLEKTMNDPVTVDLYEVRSGNTTGKTADYLIDNVREAKRSGKWVVFTFHGIGSGWLITETKEFEGLLRYLSENRETVWTAPFGLVAEYIRNNR